MASLSIIIVDPSESLAKELGELARGAIGNGQVYYAKDGYEALFRMKYVVPSVMVTDLDLHKYYSGRKLIESVLRDKRLDSMGIIVMGASAGQEYCVNEVASGRIQFMRKPLDPGEFQRSLGRILSRSGSQTLEFTVRALSAGQTLFREGENAEFAFLVKSGKLMAYCERDGTRENLGEILPGEFVGEMAYIDGEPRSASVDALVDSELIEIPINNLDVIVFSKPAWSKALLKTLSKRLKMANGKRTS